MTQPVLSQPASSNVVQAAARRRGGRSTLVQKIGLFVQTAVAGAILGYCATSPQIMFRRVALWCAVPVAVIVGVMIWSHFLARPRVAGPRAQQRAPHFSPHVWVGLLLLFLGVTGAAIYYSGGLTGYTIVARTWEWSPFTFPLEAWGIILWGAASIVFGVTQGRRTL